MIAFQVAWVKPTRRVSGETIRTPLPSFACPDLGGPRLMSRIDGVTSGPLHDTC